MGVKCFDLRHDPSGDVSRRAVLGRIVRLLRSGNCRGVWQAPPCTTFSTARHPPLRPAARPRGVQPNTLTENKQQLTASNRIVDNSLTITNICESLRATWSLENPQCSILFELSEFVQVAAIQHVVCTSAHVRQWHNVEKHIMHHVFQVHCARADVQKVQAVPSEHLHVFRLPPCCLARARSQTVSHGHDTFNPTPSRSARRQRL